VTLLRGGRAAEVTLLDEDALRADTEAENQRDSAE
jgi:hypothetical protein